jgi:hypothetical protein
VILAHQTSLESDVGDLVHVRDCLWELKHERMFLLWLQCVRDVSKKVRNEEMSSAATRGPTSADLHRCDIHSRFLPLLLLTMER